MFEQLDSMEQELAGLEHRMSDPTIATDHTLLQPLLKRRAELAGLVSQYQTYKHLVTQEKETAELLDEEHDEELRMLAQQELEELHAQRTKEEQNLLQALLPKDPSEGKKVMVEIRAGTGGDEAALFAGEMSRMYQRYAERRRWKTEIIAAHPSAMGGFKEIILCVSGKEAWSDLKHESGVHRVQRVPQTEASGRIHTSAATVVVLPEADEVDIQIEESDLELSTFVSSGPGGQHTQKNETAIRIKHTPTGLTVECQDERSQLQNRLKAMRVLRTRLLEKDRLDKQTELSKQRRAQIGTGDRSEKTRTYNFSQSRVTDHRTGLSLYNLPEAMEGDLDQIIKSLKDHERTQLLQQHDQVS